MRVWFPLQTMPKKRRWACRADDFVSAASNAEPEECHQQSFSPIAVEKEKPGDDSISAASNTPEECHSQSSSPTASESTTHIPQQSVQVI